MEQLAVMEGQYVAVHVQAATYEEALAEAQKRYEERVLNDVYLERDHAGSGDWYVAGVMGELSWGGQMVSLQVMFARVPL